MWEMIFTTAPQEYDYEYCFEAVREGKALFLFGRLARAVVVPSDRVKYQLARYGSGGYAAVLEAQMGHMDARWRPLADLRG